MAFRRSLATKASVLRRSFYPSLGHIVHQRSENKENVHSPSSTQPHCEIANFILPQLYDPGSRLGNSGVGGLFGRSKCFSALPLSPGDGHSFYRYMSSAVGGDSGNVERLGDVAENLTEKTMEMVSSQPPPVIDEVAIAAADSALPVAALQYLIDAVHSFTGLNWWAAIAVATILIRGATLPLLVNELKATYKFHLIRPRMEEIKRKVQESGMDPIAVAEGQKEMNALLKEYGVSPFTPFRGLLIHGPTFICFFFAILNMVEKVPSLKTGGTFWFTDLTTPDNLYIFPVLSSLSFLILVECNVQEGFKGNPSASISKKFARIISLLAIPFTMGFPKALFCYWITSNLFTLSYGLAFKHPEVRKLLNLPGAPISPASASKSWSSSISEVHQLGADEENKQSSESSKVAYRRVSSNAVLRQRIRILEKELKKGKKNKL